MTVAEPTLDFDDVMAAVKQSDRGRWFLKEFESRLRKSDTGSIMAAIGKLEALLAADRKNFGPLHVEIPGVVAEVFEPLATPAPSSATSLLPPQIPTRSEVERGAQLTIRRLHQQDIGPFIPETAGEPAAHSVPAKPVFAHEIEADIAGRQLPPGLLEQPELMSTPAPAPRRSRVVIIKRKPEELLEVPLMPDEQVEFAA